MTLKSKSSTANTEKLSVIEEGFFLLQGLYCEGLPGSDIALIWEGACGGATQMLPCYAAPVAGDNVNSTAISSSPSLVSPFLTSAISLAVVFWGEGVSLFFFLFYSLSSICL